MTRQIAFSHTACQLLRGEKTVTRRLGWRSLSLGDTLVAVTNHSASARVLGTIVVVSAWRERLDAIKQDDCVREGFPDLSRRTVRRDVRRDDGMCTEYYRHAD